MRPHFIGLGAQRAGTSWIYACLYEHPQVYIPVKEIHFFSRDRNYRRGVGWYEGHFRRCPPGKVAGEFSTTYLASEEAPGRIREYHPGVKLIASLRDPLERALSNYRNDVMGGVVRPGTPFEEALKEHPEYIAQGLYSQQLQRYLDLFPRSQLLVLIYEDALRDPAAFIRQVYAFLGVDSDFRPSMLGRRINTGRVPRWVALEVGLDLLAQALRTRGMHRLVWLLRRWGVGPLLRRLNTRPEPIAPVSPEVRARLREVFAPERERLERLLGRDLGFWLREEGAVVP